MSVPKRSGEGLHTLAPLMRLASVCVTGTILMFGASFTSCLLIATKARQI